MDWSYWSFGYKINNGKDVKFMNCLNVGEPIEVIVDREKGTVGFSIDGKYQEAY